MYCMNIRKKVFNIVGIVPGKPNRCLTLPVCVFKGGITVFNYQIISNGSPQLTALFKFHKQKLFYINSLT